MPSATSTARRVRRGDSALCTSAIRAMMPPSPSLSARMITVTYLIDTMIVIDQKTNEMIP